MNRKNNFKKLTLSAVFLALGLVLPFMTSQIKEIGDTLLPMHLPVLVCGLVCGAGYGGVIGLILPIMRSMLFSMPPLYPNSIWMALELATYGFVAGILCFRVKNYKLRYLYFCLISAMVSGRIVWGISKSILLGVSGKAFTFGAFITGVILDSIPGIIVQLVLIPIIVSVIRKSEYIE